MCLIVIRKNPTQNTELVVLHNRDELADRPFSPMKTEPSGVICGRDLQAGGTWLAFSVTHGFSAVLNIRIKNSEKTQQKSRGEIPEMILSGSGRMIDTLGSVVDYLPFTAIRGNRAGLVEMVSSVGPIERKVDIEETFAFSNQLGDVNWEKSQRAEKNWRESTFSHEEDMFSQAFQLLLSREGLADSQLPETGLPIEWERKLASNFVEIPDRHYQTVLSTVAIFFRDGSVEIRERNHLTGAETRVSQSSAIN